MVPDRRGSGREQTSPVPFSPEHADTSVTYRIHSSCLGKAPNLLALNQRDRAVLPREPGTLFC